MQAANVASAQQQAPKGGTRQCSQCKVETVVFPVARCKPCNTIYNRVLQCKKVMDGSCIQAFDAMDKDKKIEFYNTCRELTGQHLKGFMKQFIEKEVQTTTQTNLSGNGVWRDEADLRKKYAEKPEQLADVKANARTMHCALRECMLYEDLDYNSGFLQRDSHTDKRKWEYYTEDTVRAKKQQKVGAKAVELGEQDENKLDEKQMKRLQDFGTHLQKFNSDILYLNTEIGELGQYIAPVVKFSLEELGELCKCKKAIYDEVLTTESSSDFLGVMRTLHEFKELYKHKKNEIEKQVKQAAKAVSCGPPRPKGKKGKGKKK